MIFIFEINGKIDKINWIFRFFKSLSLWFLTFVLLTCTLYYYTSLYMNIFIGLCIVTWPYTVIDVFSDNIKISHGLVDNTIFSFFFSLQEIAIQKTVLCFNIVKYSIAMQYILPPSCIHVVYCILIATAMLFHSLYLFWYLIGI